MPYVNPVDGRIQGHEELWDGHSYRVVSSFDEHVASGRPAGVDIGNGQYGGSVYSVATGVVMAAFTDPNGALVLRIRHTLREFCGYAHMSGIGVSVGDTVTAGQRIATLGDTGAAGQPHVHIGLNRDGQEVNIFPELNQEGDVEVKGVFEQTVNAVTHVKGSVPAGNFMAVPTFVDGHVQKQYPPGQEFFPEWGVHGGTANGTDVWRFGAIHEPGVKVWYGYFHESELDPLKPAQVVPAPIPPPTVPPDIAAAKAALTTSTAKISAARTNLTAALVANAVAKKALG